MSKSSSIPLSFITSEQRLWSLTLFLSYCTIGYNVAEGIIASYFGLSDESLALFGFGLDSFIEVISGVGILMMVYRTRRHISNRTSAEQRALRISGTAFYLLALSLVIGAGITIWFGKKPETTIASIIITSISILLMWTLSSTKISLGKRLNSPAIIADGKCTRVCLWMSVVVLASASIFHFTSFGYIDAIGAIGLAYFSWKEGKESFEKASSEQLCGCEDSCH
ncbi:MAG: cation transporter [Candidatus Kapabacteria bacterium]|nr:cation transporter [Candidatus Kapabacteria bacterium]